MNKSLYEEWDNTQALSEGWGIFVLDPPGVLPEPYQLQAVCNPELGPLIFGEGEDEAAWDHVQH